MRKQHWRNDAAALGLILLLSLDSGEHFPFLYSLLPHTQKERREEEEDRRPKMLPKKKKTQIPRNPGSAFGHGRKQGRYRERRWMLRYVLPP